VPIVVNIVLPTLTFFVLTRSAGVHDVPALLLSGVWPIVEIAYTVRQQHHVDEFSVFILLGIVVFLATLLFGRPLTFYLGRRFATDGSKTQRDWWDGLWQCPQFRGLQRRLGAAWGLALVGEAVVRAVLTWQLGTSAMVLVNNTMPYVVIAVMVTVSITVGRRAQADAARRGATTAAPPTTPPGARTT